jgi:predicted glycosyltransferase
MESKGHRFVITNRDSPIINQLLDYYEIPHHIRNKRPEKQSFLASILYLMGMIKYCILYSFKQHPDLYMGFGASQCAITSFFFRKPCILLDDTEHNKFNHILYKPFISTVLTPFYFRKKLNKKQIYFDAYIEQLYLHSRYYKSNPANHTPYALIRYISYNATHDSEVRPLSDEIKKKFLMQIKNKMPVFVSLESTVTDPFYDEYKLKISPEKIFDVMTGASLFLTEGATMASEAGILGVPYIYINPLQEVGNVMEQVKKYPEIAAETINEKEINSYIENRTVNIITPEQKEKNRNEIEKSTINPTEFLVWFVENYPQSAKIMKENPNYQYNFK